MDRNALQNITGDPKAFLAFLKSKYLMFHKSNVFFRDLHYGVMAYLESRGLACRYGETEEIAWKVIETLEQAGFLIRVDDRTWCLQYEEFRLIPQAKPAPSPA